ncbi:MAG: hypothetical protein HYY06_27295 [Deltaproteobacteria bacterium]|nr:hypothetical protein [Deltaproteobacteria bacterium]
MPIHSFAAAGAAAYLVIGCGARTTLDSCQAEGDAASCDCEAPEPDGPTAWKIEIVDSGPQIARQSSLAIDADGFAHVAYQDGRPEARYATNVTGEWVASSLAQGTCRDGDIAVDPSGSPHVVCTDVLEGLRHATTVEGAWLVDTIDPEGEEGSVATDLDGAVSLVYSVPCTNDPPEPGLRRAILPGPSLREQIDPDCSTHRASVQIDRSGALHVSYAVWIDWNVYEIRHATSAGGQWSSTTVQTLDGPEYELGPSKTSLAVDPSGAVHLVYARRGTLYHAHGRGDGWTVEAVDVVRATAGGATLVSDATGALHLGYYERGTTDLRHATKLGGAWTVETVESATSDGFPDGTVGLAVDDVSGTLHLSYRSDATDELRHALRPLVDDAGAGCD